ncbi:MAG: SLBB domain-containing protein, partial [Candidatus Zixiibacteriota bacterium]
MKRFLVLTGLVIILVSLNWFRQLLAQDITDLSEADRAKLVESFGSRVTTPELPGSYASPLIYDTVLEPGGIMIRKDSVSVDSAAEVAEKRQLGFEELRPFGVELFSGPRETTPPNDIASDENYVLGPGDHVVIYLWGRVDKQYDLTVDREGKVFIPKVGELIAWGKSLGEFKTLARRALSGAYSDFDLMISLGKIRSIRIYLTGEVCRPGAYTVSSLTSLFNALYLAGGPNENGSMRAIRLMRSGKEVAVVDLYKFLLEGDNSLDVRLESGDAIFVPVTGPRVAIRGEVKRPAVYELTEGETVGSCLKLAGGETSVAYRNRVMLERVGTEDEWEVRDLNLSDGGSPGDARTVLTDGDRITVFSIFEAKKNIVAVFGQVKHPGYYERNDSARVSDLIRQGQLQDYDVYYRRANLFRRHSDWRVEVVPVALREILDGEAVDPLLLDRDSLHIYSIADVNWRKRVRISGCVQRPGEYPYYDNMTVADLIFIAGSYDRGASRLQAELARVDNTGEVTIDHIDLGGSQAQSTILREDDQVYIRWIPQWRRHRTVKVGGEVKYPGEYMLRNHDETLWSLLQRAGGFTVK